MTHYELMLLEQSDLQAAIDHVRSAPPWFMMEVARDESYSKEWRAAACFAALPIVHGPPPGGPVVDDNDPRLVEVMTRFRIPRVKP
jgi:hypothetical protein